MRMTLLPLAMTAILTVPAAAGQQQPPTPTYEQAVFNTWRNLHNKILTMAKDFPEDKYGWKPHPDSRSVLEEFRHVTIGLEMTTAILKGEKFDYPAREKADVGKPATRQSMVSEMEAAIAASFPLVEKSPSPRLVGWIDHQGEHYGKLVNAYRVNGVVPPISRPKK